MINKLSQPVPFLCCIGFHSWEELRDPIGTKAVRHWSVAPTCIYSTRVHNKVCTKCCKRDMAADRIRERLAQKESLAAEVYGEG